ncbi:DUF3102 domain-containing protein [Leptospira meyeri]|uniref:DUF3102 domain-containing protein n=1 Tax=Leptospira meyeri TaxID=29508 RepID=UPI0002BE119B|nr:DUF3102 domain-containing protein [Leptospira meyeri]EMJ90286.1 PF11300 domain protein [Leptospira meyeri serovar Semaranga str. Veldrot Semarang 173]
MSKERTKLISSLGGKRPGEKDLQQGASQDLDNDVVKINELHQSMISNMSRAIQSAIMIGEILVHKKQTLPHGAFLPWVEKNAPFSRASAANYMRMYENRDLLNVKRVLHLRDALKLLSEESTHANNEKVVNKSAKDIYKDFRAGKNLTKTEKETVKTWLTVKVSSLKTKAKKIEEEIKKL